MRKTHGMRKTRTYSIWAGMMARCYQRGATSYPRYGARGVTVCAAWHSFIAFFADMGERPPGSSLGRIDNNGHYEPGNCRWESASEQACNRRSNRLITAFDETKAVAQWARETGLNKGTIISRLELGWSGLDAITKPARFDRRWHGVEGSHV